MYEVTQEDDDSEFSDKSCSKVSPKKDRSCPNIETKKM